LFLFAMPATAFLIGYYLRVMENAFQSIDEVVIPSSEKTARRFSEFISGRLRYAWMSWIFPVSLAVPIVLTLIADGRDIIAPLRSQAISPSKEIDWSTFTYSASPKFSPLWYLGFNLLAWSMQIFLSYCAVLIILLTTFLLGMVFRHGLGGRAVAELLMPPGAQPLPEKYVPLWNFKKQRCGLEKLDVVFGVFVALIIAVLLACSVSILANVYQKKGADLGSAILAFGTVFLLPAAALWVFQPYFTNFPKSLPVELKDQPGNMEPSPWPFGSEKVAWGTIVAAWGLWIFLVWNVLKVIFPGLTD